MIGIVCDSATDLPQELIKKYEINVVFLKIILGEKSYKDIIEINEEEVLKYMENSFAKTSLPSYTEIEEVFLEMINKGYDEIIAINISSGLSGTYNLFNMVARDIMNKHKSVKIKVIDSLSVSIGTGLMVLKAAEMNKNGESFDKIVSTIESIAKEKKSDGGYTIPTLKYLKAGGRISHLKATIASVLHMKPVISVDTYGKYFTVSKARGMKNAVNNLYEYFKTFTNGKEIEKVAIYRSGELQRTINFVNELKEKVEKFYDKEILIGKVSSAMTVHAGAGLVCIVGLVK
ncbi:hypothetical protein OSSY52_22290 [Tepiditoga spiralis]|uniref:DegV family protein n=1 Tax=Tepiditoga spiralis TaxID=2108365 RepID=A0A7G1G6A3_9BACT|nr:DegV family protein [Tepiditoga spiralis]BBE32088.1 hypothetical protein OSSY52_22290 [Tepiditoga spiralis]